MPFLTTTTRDGRSFVRRSKKSSTTTTTTTRRRKLQHELLSFLFFLLLCWSFIAISKGSGSATSSVWVSQPEQDDNDDSASKSSSSRQRPLHWLQQNWPNLFGHHHHANENTKHKSSSSSSTKQSLPTHSPSSVNIAGADPSRRRRLYQNAWQNHVTQQTSSFNTTNAGNHTAKKAAFELFSRVPANAFPPFPPSMRQAALERVRYMFTKAYDGYFWNAWPAGELAPVSCQGTNFSLIKLPALTAVDALDTFWVLRNTTEMVRIVERLRQLQNTQNTSLWDVNENVSVFETTIRVLGGLLSAHQILVALPQAEDTKVWQHDIWDSVTGQVLDGRSAKVLPSQARCPAPLVCAPDAWSPHCLDGGPIGSSSNTNTLTTPDFVSSTSSCCNSCQVTNTTRRPATTATYQYDGFLLELAVDMADRMILAFETPTGIPYGTVNLQNGVPPGETPVASLAGAGTLVLEWELLSRLTGRPAYGQVARLAARALWMRQSKFNLVGKHIDSRNGQWVESLSGIGSNSDSFIEYLVKYCLLFLDGQGSDGDFRTLWPAIYQGIHEHLRKGDWYADADYSSPSTGRGVFESLMAFYPGLQLWLGELAPAARSLNAFFLVREHLGFLPERFLYNHWRAEGPKYPLRPELFESNYLMHRTVERIAVTSPFSNHSTHSGWLWAAFWSIEKLALLETSCGYASLNRVDAETTGSIGGGTKTWKAENDMPSFFLSETLKYLYLTFDEENIIHKDRDRQWMFNTEAHPIHLPVDESRSTFRKDLRRLEEILVHKTKRRKAPKKSEHVSSDQWSEETTFKKFLSHLWPVELEIQRKEINRPHDAFFFQNRHVLQPSVSNPLDMDSWDEIENYQNLAHLNFAAGGVGAGFSLRSACPNFYASDLLWIHALNGDSLDFTDGFISAKEDHARDRVMKHGRVYGSADALALLGMRYNPSQRMQTEGCPLHGAESGQNKPKMKPLSETTESKDEVFQFESEMGSFQITAFQDGTGFSVERLDDGQSVSASFVHAFDSSQQAMGFLMLSAETEGVEGSSRLSIADFSGNSFSCEVILSKISNESDPGKVVGDEILRVPCTPAMFGPTHMTNLIQFRGASVRAPIHFAVPSDPQGCKIPKTPPIGSWMPKERPGLLDTLDVCPNVNIQIVIRGTCSFMTKATNQQNGRSADAVIVINTLDDLFTMASDPNVDAVDPDQAPLSVMVSRGDGQRLVTSMHRYTDNTSRVVGEIQLKAQPTIEELDAASIENGPPLRLPLVHATEALIQIYAEGYWGIQATVVQNNWNLQLVRHKLG